LATKCFEPTSLTFFYSNIQPMTTTSYSFDQSELRQRNVKLNNNKEQTNKNNKSINTEQQDSIFECNICLDMSSEPGITNIII
jgi:hypothetical protein